MLFQLLSNIKIQEIYPISSIPLYVFIFATLVLIANKVNKTGYFLSLVQNVSLEKKQFQSSTVSLSSGNVNFLAQLSYVLLFSCGIWIYSKSLGFNFSFFLVLFGFSLFYVFQMASFFSFSGLIGDREKVFFQHRLIQNELISLFLFPIVLIMAYAPIDMFYLFPSCVVLFSVLSWIRSSIYLDRFVSGFHIIVYLCTLELIPILFLLKFVLTN